MINNYSLQSQQPTGVQESSGLSKNAYLIQVLSGFDAKNLSSDDAKTIVKEIRSIDNISSQTLGKILQRAGFDPRDLITKAGITVEPRPAPEPEPAPKGKINAKAITALKDAMDGYNGAELSEADWSSIFADLQKKGVDISKPLLDIKT